MLLTLYPITPSLSAGWEVRRTESCTARPRGCHQLETGNLCYTPRVNTGSILNCWYTRAPCCHPDLEKAAWRKGSQEPHEIQQVQSPESGEAQARDQPAGIQLGRKGLRVLMGTKLNMNPSCALATKKIKDILGCSSAASRTREISFPTNQHWWDPYGELGPVLGSSAEKRHGHIEQVQQRGHGDDEGTGVWGEAERPETLEYGEEKAMGNFIHVYKYYMGGLRSESQALSSGARWQDERQWAQTETQMAQGRCQVSTLGDTWKPSGHGPGPMLVVGCSAWAEGLDQVASRDPCPTSTIPWLLALQHYKRASVSLCL